MLDQIRSYSGRAFRGDLFAGITVAIMVVPQGMAYAMLAGLPPIYGLYAAMIPMMVYPLFGSSRQLSVGPVALVSILVLAGLSEIAAPGTPEFIELALLTAFIAGVIQVLMAILRMGFLVNFLSEPVIAGFTYAAAIIIGISQVKYLLGLDIDRSTSIVDMVKDLAVNVGDTNFYALIIGLGGIVIIVGLKRVRKSIPGALIAVIIGAVVVSFFNLSDYGVEVIGEVERGLPKFSLVPLSIDQILAVLPLAGVICLISFIESLAIAKAIAARHHNYPINANRELLALGLAKVVGALFLAYPNTGSFTRSAINDEAGATTGLSSIFGGLVIVIALLFLTPLLYFLPSPILAAIVIAAVIGLIDVGHVRRLFFLDRRDFYVLMATFILTLLFGVQEGVFAGIVLSVLMLLYKSSRPHYAVLGNLDGTSTYRNVKRYPNAHEIPGYLIVRYDVDIYFGNAEHFYDSIMKEFAGHEGTTHVLINFSAIGDIDSTGLHKMGLLVESLQTEGVKVLISGARGPLRDLLHKSGIQDRIGLENCYLTVHDAISDSLSDQERSEVSLRYASQHNVRKKNQG